MATELNSSVVTAIGAVFAAIVLTLGTIRASSRNRSVADRAAIATVAEQANDHLILAQRSLYEQLITRMKSLEDSNVTLQASYVSLQAAYLKCEEENKAFKARIAVMDHHIDELTRKVDNNSNVIRIGMVKELPDTFKLPEDNMPIPEDNDG